MNPLQRLLTELNDAEAVFALTRRDYSEADDAYSDRGEMLEAKLSKQMEGYTGEGSERPPQFRQAARAVINTPGPFASQRFSMTTGIAALILGVRSANAASSAKVVRGIVDAVAKSEVRNDAGDTGATLEDIRALLQNLSERDAQQVVLVARAAGMLRMAAEAQQMATGVLATRQWTLEEFLHEAHTTQAGAALGAITKILWSEKQDEIFLKVLEVAGKFTHIVAETALPFLKVATVAYDVHKELKDIHERPFRRQAGDDVLELPSRLEESSQAADKAIDTIGAVTDSVIKALQ